MATHVHESPCRKGEQLEAIAWALFFIWVGLSFLLEFGWGLALLGVGVLSLGGQVTRRVFDLRVDRGWVLIGILFLMGGIWGLFQVTSPLLPALFVAAGAVLLISTLRNL